MYKVTTVFLLLVVFFFAGVLSQKNCVFVQNLMDGKCCVNHCCVNDNLECECNNKNCQLCVSCTCKK
jgi:hypothetical protein